MKIETKRCNRNLQISLAIRQNGKFQNGVYSKTKHAKIYRAFFSCNHRSEIRPFAISSQNYIHRFLFSHMFWSCFPNSSWKWDSFGHNVSSLTHIRAIIHSHIETALQIISVKIWALSTSSDITYSHVTNVEDVFFWCF